MVDEITIKIRPASKERVLRHLAKLSGQPLQQRLGYAIRGGLGLMVAPMKAQARRHDLSGKTSGSIRVRKLSLRSGESVAYSVRPATPQAHLVIRPHRIMPRGTNTGRRTAPDPYVDRVVSALEPEIKSFVDEAIRTL